MMIQSHVIEVNGTFLGAAVRQAQGYRFVAVDVRMDELDGSVLATLDDAKRYASCLLRTGRLPQVSMPTLASL